MDVRRAGRGDVVAIGRMADAAHWAAYPGLLEPATIAALLRRDFSPGSLRRRVLEGRLILAEEAGRLLGFVDAFVEADHIRLATLAADPDARDTSVGTRLLEAVRGLAPGLAVSADVVLGCLALEAYLEAQGFVPGEILETTLFGQQIVERRWWLALA
ncbi:MAG TPA: GNAT family N-acetyltransferase [Acidimicrobiia bacterium]|nr:GNAT family N-acetyltransferase [Acidimicrobiia bacterium]